MFMDVFAQFYYDKWSFTQTMVKTSTNTEIDEGVYTVIVLSGVYLVIFQEEP